MLDILYFNVEFCYLFNILDDTYMYDDALRGPHYAVSGIHPQGHWYDEPPYESDPDDFLMSGINCGPAATIQVNFLNKNCKTIYNIWTFC